MGILGMILVVVMAFAVFGGANYYVGRRLCQCVRYVLPQMPTAVFAVIFVVSALLLIFAFARSALPLPDSVKNVIGTISVYWMGIFIYLFLFLAAADVLLALGRLIRLIGAANVGQCRFWSVLIAVIFAAATSVWGFYNASRIHHVSYDVTLSDKDMEPMHIVLISDLHLGAVGSEKRLVKIVREINALQPDLVCIAGDLFDNDYCAIDDPDRAQALFGSVKSTYGIYASLGNHDAGQTVGDMLRFLDRSGIRLLNDANVVIDDRFVLVGRLDGSPIGGFGELGRNDTGKVMAQVPDGLPVIVMDHNPANIDQYDGRTDLILCGHTHKGQIFPGGLITALMYTVDHGYYQKDAQSPHVVVSSGVGTWGMPMRVGTQCEIVSIHLKGQ